MPLTAVLRNLNQALFVSGQVILLGRSSFSHFSKQVILLKQTMNQTGTELVGKNTSELASGLVFGVQLGRNTQLARSLQVIGMSQLWSASGFSISLYIFCLERCLQLLFSCSRLIRTILILFGLLSFWYASSQAPSLQRAVITSSLALVVRELCYRQISSLRSLFFSVLLIILVQPFLLDSLSLQFSVAAVLGVISLRGLFLSWLSFTHTRRRLNLLERLFQAAGANLALFLSLQLGMLPLISLTWGELNLFGVITSVLLASFAPLLFYLGMIWCCWTLLVILFQSFFSLSRFVYTISTLLLLPLTSFTSFAQSFSQVEELSIRIPQFSTAFSIIWFAVLLLIRWLVKYWQFKMLARSISFLPLEKNWSSSYV